MWVTRARVRSNKGLQGTPKGCLPRGDQAQSCPRNAIESLTDIGCVNQVCELISSYQEYLSSEFLTPQSSEFHLFVFYCLTKSYPPLNEHLGLLDVVLNFSTLAHQLVDFSFSPHFQTVFQISGIGCSFGFGTGFL